MITSATIDTERFALHFASADGTPAPVHTVEGRGYPVEIRHRPPEDDTDQVSAIIDAINATGFGLTLGIHSRIDETIERIVSRVRAGNGYVNRNMIGAVVGVQPFGGEGLSGTGPKAGGPHYLPRFATERTLSVNTTAAEIGRAHV